MEFQECETCRAKSGSPELCGSCLNNRAVIDEQRKTIKSLSADLGLVRSLFQYLFQR